MAEQDTSPDTSPVVTDESAGESPAPVDVHDLGEADTARHPHPSVYVGVAVILAVVTAGEVGLYYVSDVATWIITLGLLVLMAVKFFMVAMWFMHLKFETPIFRRLFYGGLALAVAVYAIVLGASHVFPILV